MTNEKKTLLSQEDIMRMLGTCYEKSINGLPMVSPPIEKMAQDYLVKERDPGKAAKAMLKNQVTKCTTSGFLTGLGGALTLPIAIPANLGSVIYVQMRMIACTAYMAGYDITSDQVQTLVYACLAGVSVTALLKQAGIKTGMKMSQKAIQRIPGKIIVAINQKVGFRFVTKFGQKGIINLGKLVPGIGGVVNGGFDFLETRAIADRAYRMFFEEEDLGVEL